MSELNAHEIESGVALDWVDDRDADYVRRGDVEIPPSVGFGDYKMYAEEAWHQRGEECTGFALAAMANYQIRRELKSQDEPSVSRRMLYEMAQVYDGESHVEGSTLRGALKGWKSVGATRDELWPYDPDDENGALHGQLTLARVLDARTRSLIRYQRIKGEDIDTMKQALAEGHALYVAAGFHAGWYRLFLRDIEPVIEQRPADVPKGVHAFVIVGYDERGFWMHNSWGPEWGDEGYALLPYEQWKAGATDVWVTEVEVEERDQADDGDDGAARQTKEEITSTYRDMWPHLVVLGDDGRLASSGLYEMDKGSVGTLLYLFDEYTKENEWEHRRLAVFADDGRDSTATTIERLRPVRDQFLEQGIYPIFVVWETPWLAEVRDDLDVWMRRGAEQQVADGVEGLSAKAAGVESVAMLAWREIEKRSRAACDPSGGGAQFLAGSIAYKRNQKDFDLHLISHGAGDHLLAGLADILPHPITSVTAVAPATTMRQFRDGYRQLLDDGCLQNLTVVAVDDISERADNVGSIPRSFLYLISQVLALDIRTARRALKDSAESGEWPLDPVPLLGMETFLTSDDDVVRLIVYGKVRTEIVSQRGHFGLRDDTGVREAVIKQILKEHVPIPDPSDSNSRPMPSDPLAYAEAVQRMREHGSSDLDEE